MTFQLDFQNLITYNKTISPLQSGALKGRSISICNYSMINSFNMRLFNSVTQTDVTYHDIQRDQFDSIPNFNYKLDELLVAMHASKDGFSVISLYAICIIIIIMHLFTKC